MIGNQQVTRCPGACAYTLQTPSFDKSCAGGKNRSIQDGFIANELRLLHRDAALAGTTNDVVVAVVERISGVCVANGEGVNLSNGVDCTCTVCVGTPNIAVDISFANGMAGVLHALDSKASVTNSGVMLITKGDSWQIMVCPCCECAYKTRKRSL